MFETSRDILNLAITTAIILITLIVVVIGVYITLIIRDFRQLSKSVRDKIKLIDTLVNKTSDTLDLVNKKIKSSSTYITVFAKIADKFIDYLREKSKSKKQSKQSKKKKVNDEE